MRDSTYSSVVTKERGRQKNAAKRRPPSQLPLPTPLQRGPAHKAIQKWSLRNPASIHQLLAVLFLMCAIDAIAPAEDVGAGAMLGLLVEGKRV